MYLIISVTAAVLLCLILVIGRLIVQRRRSGNEDTDSNGGQGDTKIEQSNSGETSLPNGFSDDISEIDADIDLTTPIPTGVHSISKNEVSKIWKLLLQIRFLEGMATGQKFTRGKG